LLIAASKSACRPIQNVSDTPKEVTGQPQSGVCCHGTLAGNNLADATLRHANCLGQAVLGDTQRLQELMQQDLAGSGVGDGSHGRACLES